jgi:hypothetical protein
MEPAEFILWAIVWFAVGRLSGRAVVPRFIDLAHDLRQGRVR